MTKKKTDEEVFEEISEGIKENYIVRRNRLVNTAEKFADSQTNSDKKHANWNKIYFQHMDKLAFEAGLQSARFHPDEKEK